MSLSLLKVLLLVSKLLIRLRGMGRAILMEGVTESNQSLTSVELAMEKYTGVTFPLAHKWQNLMTYKKSHKSRVAL